MNYDFSLQELLKLIVPLKELENSNLDRLDREIGIYYLVVNLYSNLDLLKHLAMSGAKTQPLITLGRMIIDNYSILFLLSSYSTKEEQNLRYYLYLLDSISVRSESVKSFHEGIEHQLTLQHRNEKESLINHDKRIITKLKAKIVSENLQNITSQNDIAKYNWKFQSVISAKNKSYYNWYELYNIAKIPKPFSETIQKHFSAFVHGLGMVIIYEQKNKAMEESVMSLLMIVQFLTAQIIVNEYSELTKNVILDKEFKLNMHEGWNNWK
ncbi:hypothetical protein DR871_000260 [Flavobacterium petrolei]|uniref:Uncharacterized protein n=1 Tax=Flavobacterium petrolei TaxID=2259594 RepID=A0A482TX89_9FLAO|nr:hypothetical protein [Flavobacterium petrolei]RYJ52522.1 hypothetical protein DR871_000260 [Flavobacterium petrolei]